MNHSKKEVENAVIIVAESLNIKDGVEYILRNVGIHSTIKEVVYKLFLDNKQDYFEKNDLIFDSIQILRNYAKEMSLNGQVVFKKDLN
jgi:hypothetical protein